MLIKGSNIAKQIDIDFRKEQKYKQKQFIKKYCENCKNKFTNYCNITTDIKGKLKCSEYIKSEDK